MASLCHAWFTTTNLSYRFPILKLPPPPCAVLLVCNLISTPLKRHTHTQIYIYICIYIHTYIHTQIYIYIYIYIYMYLHTYIHTYTNIYIYIFTYIHTYIHSYIHTYIHKYIYIYTYLSVRPSIHLSIHIHQQPISPSRPVAVRLATQLRGHLEGQGPVAAQAIGELMVIKLWFNGD